MIGNDVARAAIGRVDSESLTHENSVPFFNQLLSYRSKDDAVPHMLRRAMNGAEVRVTVEEDESPIRDLADERKVTRRDAFARGVGTAADGAEHLFAHDLPAFADLQELELLGPAILEGGCAEVLYESDAS